MTDERKRPTSMTRTPRTRRAVWLAAAAALLAGGIVGPAAVGTASAATTSYRVTSSASQVELGKTVTVTVTADDVDDLYAYTLTLGYDPKVLSYVPGSATTPISGRTYASASGGALKVTHTKLGTSPAASGDVTLLKVTFTTVAVGSATVTGSSLVSVTSSNHSTTSTGLGSTTVRAVSKPAPKATSKPKVTGTARVGKVLAAGGDTWSVAGVSRSYQWLRDGKKISGATGSRRTVTSADVGKKLSVTVTATKPDHLSGSVTSAPTAKVTKATSKTTIKVTKKPKRGAKVTVTVTVKASGVVPTGKVKIVVAGKTVAKAKKLSHGVAKVTFRAKAKGSTKVKVTYQGSAGVKKSSRAKTFRVR